MSRDSGSFVCGRNIGDICAALLVALVLASPVSAETAADTSAIDAYLHAITQKDTSSRLAELERFVSAARFSSLRIDALEWIVWDEKQTDNDAAAVNWARELLKADAENALGLAIAADAERQASQSSPTRYPAHEEMAKRGLANMARLRRPEGMSNDEFSRLRQRVEGVLNAAAGAGSLQRKDYAAARLRLGKAVTASPNDARLVYELALADLSGDKPDRQQGYWLLARAVNLSGGASAARQIEEFGRNKYKKEGGTDRDWEQFLAVTAAPGANASTLIMASGTAAPGREGHTREATQVRVKQHGSASKAAAAPKGKQETQIAKNRTDAPGSKREWKGEPEPAPEYSDAVNSLPPISEERRHAARTGAPLSLGILIETSMTRAGTRDAIVHSLTDLVRRLGSDDEAFILSFSHNLVFEQDLTGNAQRLEQAMEEIKPNPGTALLDAAGFAAGHLRRIAKNDSRVLLVISDGQNASSRIPALASSSEIRASGVKIYCIGVDVAGTEGMYRLQGLASATGGIASFISAPNQFRAAAQQVAGHIGIRFDY